MAWGAGKGGGDDKCCVYVSSENEPLTDSEREAARLCGREPEEYAE